MVSDVSPIEYREFLEKHHIQGYASATHKLALREGDKLVAVIGYVKTGDRIELTRYATACNVVGGFTRLLKHSIKKFGFTDIITFLDLRWADPADNMYVKAGFTVDKVIPPGYLYVEKETVSRREKFMKHKLHGLGIPVDPTLSERENLKRAGIHRLYDCGKVRYRLTISR